MLPEWNLADVYQAYEHYIGLLHQTARSGLFDIIAHCELVKIHGFRPTRDIRPKWESLIKCFHENGLATEINTSGLRKPMGEMYPSEEILKLIKKYHILNMFGSDAHRTQDVGRDFDRAVQIAVKHGINSVAQFETRKLIQNTPLNGLQSCNHFWHLTKNLVIVLYERIFDKWIIFYSGNIKSIMYSQNFLTFLMNLYIFNLNTISSLNKLRS